MSGRKSSRKHSARGSHKDVETILDELSQTKKKYTAVKQDNVHMRTQVQRLTAQLKKRDKQIEEILRLKLQNIGADSSSAASQKLEKLKQEMASIAKLSHKIRELETDLADKDEELKLLKSSMKYSLIKELQIEAQTYFNEARRMKRMQDKNMRLSSSRSRNNNGFREISPGEPGELEQLRQENQTLRRECVHFRQEREMEDKSYAILQQLQGKFDGLATDIAIAKEHIHTVPKVEDNC
jgi:myosin heavy subunit